jgi:hypothetical protein
VFVQWTAGAEYTGNNNYCKGNQGCDSNAYGYVNPASQTHRLRVTVAGNATVTMFNNLALAELNTKYIWECGYYIFKMHWNWVL